MDFGEFFKKFIESLYLKKGSIVHYLHLCAYVPRCTYQLPHTFNVFKEIPHSYISTSSVLIHQWGPKIWDHQFITYLAVASMCFVCIIEERRK